MSANKSILKETASFTARITPNEERVKSSPENLPNFTNPLVYNIEVGNNDSTLTESISKPDKLEFVESTRKEIVTHEIDKHWNLFRRRQLNGKNFIMYIWSYKKKRDPYGRLIKKQLHLCSM